MYPVAAGMLTCCCVRILEQSKFGSIATTASAEVRTLVSGFVIRIVNSEYGESLQVHAMTFVDCATHQMSALGEVTFRSAKTAPKRAEAVARTVKRRDAMASFEGGKATAGQYKDNVDDRGREAKRRVPCHETEPALAGPCVA